MEDEATASEDLEDEEARRRESTVRSLSPDGGAGEAASRVRIAGFGVEKLQGSRKESKSSKSGEASVRKPRSRSVQESDRDRIRSIEDEVEQDKTQRRRRSSSKSVVRK